MNNLTHDGEGDDGGEAMRSRAIPVGAFPFYGTIPLPEAMRQWSLSSSTIGPVPGSLLFSFPLLASTVQSFPFPCLLLRLSFRLSFLSFYSTLLCSSSPLSSFTPLLGLSPSSSFPTFSGFLLWVFPLCSPCVRPPCDLGYILSTPAHVQNSTDRRLS